MVTESGGSTRVSVDGHRLTLTRLDKVLYPATGTTKGDVIGYYAAVAHVLLPHTTGRPATRKRWPNGVQADSFFAKNLEPGSPDWLHRGGIEHSKKLMMYPILDSAASLAWIGQSAALEIHVPQWRFALDGSPGNPDRLVFDLDPGPGVGLEACVEVALLVREMMADLGLACFPVTSGSKGIHLYVPLDGSRTSAAISTFAKEVARTVEAAHPELVVHRMAKDLRPGKVLIDWSQNNAAKTTLAPYSLRGRERPTVATPRTWAELTAPGLEQLDYSEVVARVARGEDPLADLSAALAGGEKSTPRPAVADRLAEYRSKRTAGRTPEPVPAAGDAPAAGTGDLFVIGEHHASALHWDLRLEHDGVLVSWALPKGPPTSTRTNRLAVQTEDHPLEYADFSGRIPRGEYGAGYAFPFDRGRYTLRKWRDDEVMVTFHGQRITGDYVLVRTGGKNWLMHRMKGQPDLPEITPRTPPPEDKPTAEPVALQPMLAGIGQGRTLPHGEDWALEGKWDGVRALATVTDATLRLTSRNDNDFTASYPELAELIELTRGHRAVIDGEIVALTRAGVPSFPLLQQRIHLTRPTEVAAAAAAVPVLFYAFDLLELDGISLLGKKFRDRRALLEALDLNGQVCRTPPLLDSDLGAALDTTRELGLEGVVAKRGDSIYRPGTRSGNWLKFKHQRHQEVVIGGWRQGQGNRAGTIGGLLVGVPGPGGLAYAGRVGTGFSTRTLAALLDTLRPLARGDSPFAEPVPRPDSVGATWVNPVLVGEVSYAEWTPDRRLRHSVWRGLRPDRSAEDIDGPTSDEDG